jgi:hypothetical protein
MPVQKHKGALLPPDSCGLVTHLGEILAIGISHKKRPHGSFPKDDAEMIKVTMGTVGDH